MNSQWLWKVHLRQNCPESNFCLFTEFRENWEAKKLNFWFNTDHFWVSFPNLLLFFSKIWLCVLQSLELKKFEKFEFDFSIDLKKIRSLHIGLFFNPLISFLLLSKIINLILTSGQDFKLYLLPIIPFSPVTSISFSLISALLSLHNF